MTAIALQQERSRMAKRDVQQGTLALAIKAEDLS